MFRPYLTLLRFLVLCSLVSAVKGQEFPEISQNLSSPRQRSRLAAARQILERKDLVADPAMALELLRTRLAVEDSASVRVALLEALYLRADDKDRAKYLEAAIEDKETVVREQAKALQRFALETGSPGLAAAVFPVYSKAGCDGHIVNGNSPRLRAKSQIAANLVSIVKESAGLQQLELECLASLTRRGPLSPAEVQFLFKGIQLAKDLNASDTVAVEILNSCRSEVYPLSTCLDAAKQYFGMRLSPSAKQQSDAIIETRLRSLLFDLEGIVAAREFPVFFQFRNYFVSSYALIVALLVGLLVYVPRLKAKLKKEKVSLQNEIDGSKVAFDRQLQALGHSAQLEAARSALSHFTAPPPTLRRDNIEVAGAFRQGIGVYGDFYNWYTTNDGDIWLYLVDVEGHGFLAAISSTLIKHVLDATLETATDVDPQQVLSKVDREFERYGTTRDLAATMNLLRLSTTKGTFKLANAGMPAPLIFRYGQAHPDPIQAAGVYVGSGYSHYKVEPALAAEKATIGDLIVAYSDGVIEARNPQGQHWGVDGLSAQVLRYRDADVEEIAMRIIEGVTAHTGTEPAADDQSVVVVRVGNNAQRKRADSAPVIDVVTKRRHNQTDELECTIVNALASVDEIHNVLRARFTAWLSSTRWEGDPSRVWIALFEAILNSLRHATKKGDRIRLTFTAIQGSVIVELEQPIEWRNWDTVLGPARRQELDRQVSLDTSRLNYGTQLMLWHSDDLEVQRQGRVIKMKFQQTWRRHVSK
jgi:anti-sigma regulatory factor (Ser/Thr protein kinase)